jgi:hypothetical protein
METEITPSSFFKVRKIKVRCAQGQASETIVDDRLAAVHCRN